MSERDFIFLNCQDGKHVWKFTGGRNASCELGSDCSCSIPVHECEVCGDCDYGDNDEARQVIARCHETGTVNLPPRSMKPLLGGWSEQAARARKEG